MSSNPEKPKKGDADEKIEPPKRNPYGRSTYGGLVEQRIAEAEAQGHFRNLPGAGKPLRLNDDSNVPEEDRAAFKLLKNAGFAPPWIELQKSILADRAQLDTWLKRVNERWPSAGPFERKRLRGEYEQKLRDLARMIEHYNLTIPSGVNQLAGMRLDEELRRLGA